MASNNIQLSIIYIPIRDEVSEPFINLFKKFYMPIIHHKTVNKPAIFQ